MLRFSRISLHFPRSDGILCTEQGAVLDKDSSIKNFSQINRYLERLSVSVWNGGLRPYLDASNRINKQWFNGKSLTITTIPDLEIIQVRDYGK